MAFEAFKNIGRGPSIFGNPAGMELAKPMGTGRGNGFSIFPDFKRYTFITIWKDASAANDFLNNNPKFRWYLDHCREYMNVSMIPVKVHGQWGGVNPFRESIIQNPSSPLCVLTRATIRLSKLHEFWWNVPTVSKFMAQSEALYKIGIGEYPIMMQATFSLWQNAESLTRAAYRNSPHADIVKKTRERKWYTEELFARFELISIRFKGDRYSPLLAISQQAQIQDLPS